MRKVLTFCLALLFVLQGFGQVVSYQEAVDCANVFFGKMQKSVLNCAFIQQHESQPLFYVFNAESSFVVVAADKRVTPILAYSYNSVFNKEEIPEAAKMWLDAYANAISYLQKNDNNQEINDFWHKKYHKSNTPIEEVKPLLCSNWGQGKQYNYYCPIDDKGTNGRCVTGCVPTALGQLMYYFRFPNSGVGQYSYQDSVYGTISADFSQREYSYEAMTDKGNAINVAASRLISDIGVACDIVYGPQASGMYNHKAAYALKTFFKYNPQTEYVYRDSVSLNWDSLIVLHLNANIPLYYAGWSVPNIEGHGFICDGYQKFDTADYYYHFNFGWESSYDGYFYTNALSPSLYNFNLSQEIIAHAYPDTTLYPYPEVQQLVGQKKLTSMEGSFEVSPLKNIPQDMDYQWIVAPQTDTLKSLTLNMKCRLAENDTVWINTIFYTDTILNLTIEDKQNKEFVVRLKTTSSNSEQFHCSYTTEKPTYCNSITMYSTTTTIDDGSFAYQYNNFTYCRHKITLNGKKAIVIRFSKFETEQDKDILYFYDQSTTTKELLLALSGTLQDSVYVFNTNKLMVEFITDEENVFDGWTFSIKDTTPNTSILNYLAENDIVVFPNPVQDQLTITINEDLISEELKNTNVQLFDILGKELQCVKISPNININLSKYAKGVYFLRIGNINKKIFKIK